MDTNVTAGADAAVVASMTEVATVATVETKRKGVSSDDVFAALEKYEGQKTASQVAAILGMNVGAFNGAVQKLKNEWTKDGYPLAGIPAEGKRGFPSLIDGRTTAIRGPRQKKANKRAELFRKRFNPAEFADVETASDAVKTEESVPETVTQAS